MDYIMKKNIHSAKSPKCWEFQDHMFQGLRRVQELGMEEEGMEQHLDTFKHGMPPHGGLGIGLERLTMQLLGEENVRETCLFPRDMNRLEP